MFAFMPCAVRPAGRVIAVGLAGCSVAVALLAVALGLIRSDEPAWLVAVDGFVALLTALAAGALAWTYRARAGRSALLSAASLCWSGAGGLVELAGLHRAVLIQLAALTWVSRRDMTVVVAALGWVLAIPTVSGNIWAVLAVILVLTVAAGRRALWTVPFGLLLGLHTLARNTALSSSQVERIELAYAVAAATSVLTILWWEDRGRRRLDRVVDRVLGDSAGQEDLLRAALSAALDDPDLALGACSPDQPELAWDLLVDPPEPADRPGAGASRRIGIRSIALRQDPGLTSSVRRVVQLSLELAALREEITRQRDRLHQAGQNVLLAGDDQLQTVARQVMLGPMAMVRRAGSLLETVDTAAGKAAVESARGALARAASGLADFGHELVPQTLQEHGLTSALRIVAERIGLALEITDDDAVGSLPVPVEQTLYFACVEGMINVARHSGSDRCRIEVSRFDGSVDVRLSDAGRGGADPAGGGLDGLRERLQLAGGSLTVSSTTGSAPPGATSQDGSRPGTLLIINLPIGPSS